MKFSIARKFCGRAYKFEITRKRLAQMPVNYQLLRKLDLHPKAQIESRLSVQTVHGAVRRGQVVSKRMRTSFMQKVVKCALLRISFPR